LYPYIIGIKSDIIYDANFGFIFIDIGDLLLFDCKKSFFIKVDISLLAVLSLFPIIFATSDLFNSPFKSKCLNN